MPENNDRMASTLDTLRSDVERTPLADSLTVRRRGDQRTRRQAVGGALAVVVVVAGAAGIYGGLGGSDRATEIPASPTPSPEQTFDLAADPFLPVDALTGFGGYDESGPFIDAKQEPDLLPEQCATRPADWGASDLRATRFYQDGSEATVREYVLRFDDPAAAEQASLKKAYADLAALCPATVDPSDGTLTTRQSVAVPGLDSAVQSSRYFEPAFASEPSYYEVATAHEGNVVVVLEWHASGNPSGDGAQDWAWTVRAPAGRPRPSRRLTQPPRVVGSRARTKLRTPATHHSAGGTAVSGRS